MVTSFTKIAVVLGILRSALGTANLPPSSVLTALALLLSIYVMSPVVKSSWNQLNLESKNRASSGDWMSQAKRALPPWIQFLETHASAEDIELFESLAKERGGEANRSENAIDSLIVLAPAFMISELREAFRIGFLIFLPFLIIDLAISAIVLSLGMHMLSPTTLSLPIKLLLFVAADGWRTVCESLVSSYAGS